MMCRSVKSGQKFRRARNGIARDLFREESSSEIKRVETANEKRREGESESAGVSGNDEEGKRVKCKEQAIRRTAGDITRREGVTIFH